MKVGVLALQGDFAAHASALARRGVPAVEVRHARDLDGVTALVLPGGESTAMLRLMNGSGLFERLGELLAGGTPALATCAGVILVAREVRNPAQGCLGALDVAVERNAYGRQIDSTVAPIAVRPGHGLEPGVLEGVFIRAPRIVATGPGVEVLATRGADPVLVRERAILAATFHPELSGGSPVIDLFLHIAGGAR